MSLRFVEVRKSFGERTVLDGLSFETRAGEILFLLGRSGVGKSVTLKHLVGLIRPDSGKIYIDQLEVTGLSEEELGPVRRKCGMVFQHPALLDSLSVRANVGFGLRQDVQARPFTTAEETRIRHCLDLVQLGPEILDRKPPELSYGMQKRVSLARTLAPGPEILLFDEPTTGLDPIATEAVNELIRDLSRNLQVTSIVVSHDMRSALSVADRILVLDAGRILALGSPTEIRASQAPLIRDFLSEVLAQEVRS
jgi:phospholipid/cholesterol/gamma-HCH transport system ATP-binding protein